MAAARRNVLNGASHWEREEKATQQRDYAAQLQEQVQQKQAKQEQERARRKQEQQEELAMLGRPKTPQQQDQGQTVLLPPPQRGSSQSLQLAAETRQQELPHSPPLAATSASLNGIAPLDNEFSVGMAPLSQQVLSSPAKYGEAASTALAFSSGPSVFESLLREPGVGTRSVAFYEDLEALQRLTAEMEVAAKHRRSVAQSGYTKLDFSLQQQEPSAAPPTHASSCLRSSIELLHNKTDLRDPDVDTPPTTQQAEPQCEGLLGESVLVSLGSALSLSASPLRKPEVGSQASESPMKGGCQLVTAARSEDEGEGDASAVVALCSQSEMRPFTPSSE